MPIVKKYRKRANLVLLAVFGLFALAVVLKHNYPDSLALRVLRVVSEAALVGGIADWFAVTALFRRPLGFGWHTALIPRNRERLIEAIAGAVQNELLSKESIKARLAGVRLVDLVIRWVEEPGRQIVIDGLIKRYATRFITELEPAVLARYTQKILKQYLAATDLSDLIEGGLTWSLQHGKDQLAVDYILAELTSLAKRDSTREAILRHLEQYRQTTVRSWWQRLILDVAELTNTLNLAEAATVLHLELEQLLQDLADPNHALRRWLHERLTLLAERLATDPVWQESIRTWQHGLSVRIHLEKALTTIIGIALDSLPPEQAAEWVARQSDKLWQAFKQDPELQAWADEHLKAALGRLIESEHRLVATVVTEALQRLSDDDLSRFVEEKAGEDLAWIRINGSVVGGLVGLLLFLFLHYVYNPYLLPQIRAFFS